MMTTSNENASLHNANFAKISPKLRFKEFNDEWQCKKLKQITILLKDGTHGSYSDTNNSKYYLLSAKNIKNGLICINDDDRHISKNDFDDIFKKYSLENNDILLTIVGTIGKLAIFNQKNNYYAFQRSVAIIRFNNIDVCYKYAFQYMHTYKFQMQLKAKTTLSAQGGIYLNDLKKLVIAYPSLREQKKIGVFFTKIDQLIALHERKLALLKQKKQGYLQKLFPQKNAKMPQLRFKGFNDKWQNTQFKDLITNYPIKTFITDKCNKNGKYPIIQQGNIPIFGYSNKDPFENYNNVVLFGDHTLSLYKPQSPFLLATDGIKVISIKNFNNDFTYCVIEKYLPHSQGYKRHFKILKETKLKYPVLQEQHKIGQLFKKLDELIILENNKISLLKCKKKFYLQKMFI